jgi:exosortase/archaeosortase family protein
MQAFPTGTGLRSLGSTSEARQGGRRKYPPAQSPRPFSFLWRFVTTWVTGLGLLSVAPTVERSLIQATISSLRVLSQILRFGFSSSGPYVTVAGANLEIITDCTPIMPTLALWGAIVAFPAPVRWKAAGAILGAALLWGYNVARILVLAVVLRSNPASFEFVHVYLWQTLTMVVVLVYFVAWTRLLRRREPWVT